MTIINKTTMKLFRKFLAFNLGTIYRRSYTNRNMLKLHERGMYQDLFPDTSSEEIINLLNSGPQTIYAGFDPTAESLHVGNLLILVNLLHWQRSGHKVIALVGGATGQIGDPSERSTDRPEVSETFIRNNVQSIKANISQIFENHEKHFWSSFEGKEPLVPVKIVDNYQWYKDVNVLTFIGKIGRHFRMGTMLSRHSVQSRINSEVGMSFSEFCYQIFQAYDWMRLYQDYGCRFQLGGSDQMGNIISGHFLVNRIGNASVYGLTTPIITTEAGNKFGKSAGNAVWLSTNKCSPFELYQFFMRVRDSEVESLLRFFTFDSLGEIKELMKKHMSKPETRLAQKRLAEQVTLLVHGEGGLSSALQTTETLYSKDLNKLAEMTAEDLSLVLDGAPIIELLPKPGMTVYNLALEAGCFPRDGIHATNVISKGGFYLNNERSANANEVLTLGTHILPNKVTIARVGKKRYYIVKWLM